MMENQKNSEPSESASEAQQKMRDRGGTMKECPAMKDAFLASVQASDAFVLIIF